MNLQFNPMYTHFLDTILGVVVLVTRSIQCTRGVFAVLYDGFKFFSQGVGVTATLPNLVPSVLSLDNSGPHEWNYVYLSLWHNRMTISTDLPNLNDLKPHQSVGLLMTTAGDLHVYHNGRHTKKVATNLPVNRHLWGVVDIYGDCIKIKSELLSGELDGVCMYLYFIDRC